MKRTTLLSATLIAIALPLAAEVRGSGSPGANFIDSWDYDGDGAVTLAEVLERRGDLFASFDADEDGLLTAAEFAAHDEMRAAMQDRRSESAMGPGHGPREAKGLGRGAQAGAFARLDADADGLVSADEFVTTGAPWFARFDRDGDGVVRLSDFGPADFGQGNFGRGNFGPGRR